MHQRGIFEASRYCLSLADPGEKCRAVLALQAAGARGSLQQDSEYPLEAIGAPGRPARPELVDPARVSRRRPGSEAGRAALVHAIAHIEFNAINLALDAVYRFRDMPEAYYRDWSSVAADEARHFRLLEGRLSELGHAYGDFSAHDGLWEMAVRTADSCLARMALVPRVLEARGLDVTPGMIERLERAGDRRTARVLERILAEEERHVALGTRWFRFCCARQCLDPVETFLSLLQSRYTGSVRGPFNTAARVRAGFTEEEMSALADL